MMAIAAGVNLAEHWDKVYRTKALEAMSWHAAHLETSLEWMERAAPEKAAAILDAGGGVATLAADLLAKGYRDVTVLDVAPAAIERARAEVQSRMGASADGVRWVVGDVTLVELPTAGYDVWHDRAVFHFLTKPEERAAYVQQVRRALKPGGQAVVATFGLKGPERCSGLETCRYDAAGLAREFGAGFAVVRSAVVEHRTPWGTVQPFLYCQMERTPGAVRL
ncbi:MAG TPA: class I SAM-dependent methyltransferase [Acidobacteriaceae bacterium]|jgi:SAM-dependent methyltransferase|nr:class I SAM-dependent methyltransferase [Acidobacteriaceae bacterium]